MLRRVRRSLPEVQFVAGNRVTLLRDGREAFPAMLAAIEGAERQILLEMYWFDSDRIGRRFGLALAAAARRGVEVAVCYDAIGSLEADPAFFATLEAAGVLVHEFNPVLPWRRRFGETALSRRNHRKNLTVDGRIGFTGGVNIADAWLPREDGGQGFRDDVVCIEGPAVSGLVDCFLSTYARYAGRTITRARPAGSGPGVAGSQSVRIIADAQRGNQRQILRAYLYRVHRARDRVFVANSYFVPDARILRALVNAARRGVDVRVLLPGQSDVPVVRLASRALYERLLRAGVRLFELQKNVLHSKTAVVDGEWSTIGTFNLDHLSLRFNLEVNVAVLDPRFGAVMEQSFLEDLRESDEVALERFAKRPWLERVVERSLYRFRTLM